VSDKEVIRKKVQGYRMYAEYQIEILAGPYEDAMGDPDDPETDWKKKRKLHIGWKYMGKFVNDVPEGPYYDSVAKEKTEGLYSGDKCYFSVKDNVRDEIDSLGLTRGDVVILKKEELDGGKSIIKLLNEGERKIIIQSTQEEPVYDNQQSRNEPQAPTGNMRDRSIVYQTMFKCASWLIAPEVADGMGLAEIALDVSELAQKLFSEHREIVYGDIPKEPIKGEAPLKEKGALERLFKAWGLDEAGGGADQMKMLAHMNTYREKYEAQFKESQPEIKTFMDLGTCSPGFLNYCADERESLNELLVGEPF